MRSNNDGTMDQLYERKKKAKERKVELARRCLALNRRADVYVYLTRQLCIFARHKRNGAAEAPWGYRNGYLYRATTL